MITNRLVLVRGGGDLATGVIQKLYHAGFQVLVLETPKPSAIRRMVAVCEAVYEHTWTVEDLTAVRIGTFAEAQSVWQENKIPILIDPQMTVLAHIKPQAIVDAILAKKNLGLHRNLAPITLALGPGFWAGTDCDGVIETMRGHDLGRLIWSGEALPNTGTPGPIAGVGVERVIHAPAAGLFQAVAKIGDFVFRGDKIAQIEGVAVIATLDGILRGLIRDGYFVTEGLKIADIDPRSSEQKNCLTISDKARCLGGAVLEALLMLQNR